MSELTPEQFPGHQPGSPTFPELLVCASVNLSDQGTTPPGQSSLSFVFGPREIGSPNTVVVPQPTSWWRWLLYPAQTEEATEALGPLEMATPATRTPSATAASATSRSRPRSPCPAPPWPPRWGR